MQKKNWLVFGIYGGLLNCILVFFYYRMLFQYDSPGDLIEVLGYCIVPGLLIWLMGGLGSQKEYTYSDSWVPIFYLLAFMLWGFCLIVVTSFIWEPLLYSLFEYS